MNLNNKFKRFYITSSVYLQSVLILLVVTNIILFFIFSIRDQLRSNPVAEKHNKTNISLSYPDKDQSTINELLRETWSRGLEYESYTQFKEKPFKGKFVNVHLAGFRSNNSKIQPWPPDPNNFNIFVFGGSTTFGYGVADSETIVSYLEKKLTELKHNLTVYNFGRGFYFSTQERILFENLLSKKHYCNLAIFIDGLNEFTHIKDEPAYTNYLKNIFLKEEKNSVISSVDSIISKTSIGRARNVISKLIEKKPNRVEENQEIKDIFDKEYYLNRYLFNKKLIQLSAKHYKIDTLFVWQPIPNYKYNQNFHPFSFDGYGWHSNSTKGYSFFAQNLKSGLLSEVLWLADIQESSKEILYVDIVHYTARFNNLISDLIAKHIVQKGYLF